MNLGEVREWNGGIVANIIKVHFMHIINSSRINKDIMFFKNRIK